MSTRMKLDGYCFDDLVVGQVFKGPGRTLSETDLVMFSMVTGDWDPMHADEVYARSTPIGGRMYHGSFGISLALAMSANILRLRNRVVAALGIREWVFRAPLMVSDTVFLEMEILEKRVVSGGARAIVSRRLRLKKEDGGTAQEGIADLMIELGDF